MAEPQDQYNLEPQTDPAPAEQRAPGAPGTAPAPGKIEAQPILDLAEDDCPKCHAPLKPDAVVCMKCGYDLLANTVRAPEVGEQIVPPSTAEDAAPGEFSTPGRGSAKTVAIIGAVIALGAMIAAGVNSPPHFVPVSSRVILTLYETLLHTGTGVFAVFLAARLSEMRLGNVELAAARMLTAFATFQLFTHLGLDGPPLLVRTTLFLLGATAYWGLVMLLFKKSRVEALLVTLIHMILWIIVQLGSVLTAWSNPSPSSVAVIALGAAG